MALIAQELPNARQQHPDGIVVTANDYAINVADEAQLRAGAYSLLGALLRSPADTTVLDHLRALELSTDLPDNDIGMAMRLLGLAARDSRVSQIGEEFHELFIGIGRGELMPYGSWYLTGFLMERPLGLLREDLVQLGFERQQEVSEPEDHVAALCEVMAMLAHDHTAHDTQQQFFEQHIAPWVSQFFIDLEHAQGACFYRSVARFGAAFIDLEIRYFAMRL